MTMNEVFAPSAVVGLTGERAYARGVAYHLDGRVEIEDVAEQSVWAVVRGTFPYKVELSSEGGAASWSCDCPAAEDGSFCKHCVAVALAVAGDGAPRFSLVHDDPPEAEAVDLEGYVSGLDADQLMALVLEQADANWRLKERLVAEAQAAAGDGPSVATWKRRIDGAFAPYGDFVSYREAPGWAADVSDVIDALSDLCDAGHADAVVVLAEHAHRRADAAIQYIDDSGGWLTDISTRLSELHLQACSIAKPDPVDLARRLVDLELTSELDGFHRAAADYADVLGPAGLAEYRSALEPHEAALGPDDDDDVERWGRNFAVRNALVGWAMGTGDPDALIEVKQQDLRLPGDYLEIARMLAEAGRDDEAIEWARRGLAEHADRSWQLNDLREFLGEALRARCDAEGSVELFWNAFETTPSLSSYRRVLDEVAGDRDRWAERCVEALRDKLAGQVASAERLRSRPSDALVDILSFEGDADGAWAVAREFGTDRRKMMTLARAREADHPIDAIDVYESEVFELINQKKKQSYRAAVDLMARIASLSEAASEPERFDEVLLTARTEHRAKRNLRAMLDAKGWPDPGAKK